MGILETLLAMAIGWSLNWWTTPEAIPHTIDYKPKSVLLEKFNPDDCKETGPQEGCITGYPRIVFNMGGYIEFKDRLIDTRSELNKCMILIEEHNKIPMTYKEKELW